MKSTEYDFEVRPASEVPNPRRMPQGYWRTILFKLEELGPDEALFFPAQDDVLSLTGQERRDALVRMNQRLGSNVKRWKVPFRTVTDFGDLPGHREGIWLARKDEAATLLAPPAASPTSGAVEPEKDPGQDATPALPEERRGPRGPGRCPTCDKAKNSHFHQYDCEAGPKRGAETSGDVRIKVVLNEEPVESPPGMPTSRLVPSATIGDENDPHHPEERCEKCATPLRVALLQVAPFPAGVQRCDNCGAMVPGPKKAETPTEDQELPREDQVPAAPARWIYDGRGPCPKCGGHSMHYEKDISDPGWVCTNCGCRPVTPADVQRYEVLDRPQSRRRQPAHGGVPL